MSTLKEVWFHLRHGEGEVGWEHWEGKPLLLVGRLWYDGWHYALHIGPLWIECDYPPMSKDHRQAVESQTPGCGSLSK